MMTGRGEGRGGGNGGGGEGNEGTIVVLACGALTCLGYIMGMVRGGEGSGRGMSGRGATCLDKLPRQEHLYRGTKDSCTSAAPVFSMGHGTFFWSGPVGMGTNRLLRIS